MRALPRLKRLDAGGRELVRRLRGAPHEVDFFHQVDDPYSQLALAAIPRLAERYAVTLSLPSRLARRSAARTGARAPRGLRAAGLRLDRAALRPRVSRRRRAARGGGRAPRRALARRAARERRASPRDALAAGRTLWWRDDEAHAQRERIEADLRAGRCASETRGRSRARRGQRAPDAAPALFGRDVLVRGRLVSGASIGSTTSSVGCARSAPAAAAALPRATALLSPPAPRPGPDPRRRPPLARDLPVAPLALHGDHLREEPRPRAGGGRSPSCCGR